MRKVIVAGILAASLVGCANNVGVNPESSVSKFDGVRTVSIMPHGADCCLSIGAFWTERAPDLAILNIQLFSKYMNIEKVELKIDDKVINLQPMEGMTKFEQMFPSGNAVNMPTSTRGFAVDLADVRKIMTAKTSMIRVTTLSDGGAVGTIKGGSGDSKAYYALQRFLAEIGQK